jgi:hypothetical protein
MDCKKKTAGKITNNSTPLLRTGFKMVDKFRKLMSGG